ncbi:MAG: hypothetical protein HZA16_01575 [Nitrospirae bacterium]|nr:hypothetical protein [Nitrospirota bacterium]
MDIEAISGPKPAGAVKPAVGGDDPEPVEGTAQLVLFSLDIRDRITISPEARRRYEDGRKKKKARKEE